MNKPQNIKRLTEKQGSNSFNKKFSRDRLLIIFMGLPCSGKSLWSRKLSEYFNGIRVSTDELKILAFGSKTYNIDAIHKLQHFIIDQLAKTAVTIVSDANSDRRIYRDQLIRIAHRHGYKYVVVYCRAPFLTILKRMANRRGKRFYSTQAQLQQHALSLEVPRKAIIIDTDKQINQNELRKIINEIKK
jgi:predicted kinase